MTDSMSRKALGFDGESSGEEEAPAAPSWRATSDKSTTSKRLGPSFLNKDIDEIDESIYAYDEVYDEVSHAKKTETLRASKARRPQYIQGLLEAKNRRQEDKLRVSDLKISKERANEGDEFKDKEVFVTNAYKEHRKKVEENVKQEKKEAGEVDMKTFHRAMMDSHDRNAHDQMEHTTNQEEQKEENDTQNVEETHISLQAGLNIPSKAKIPSQAPASPPPFKKQKPSRQSETQEVLKQIEESEKEKKKKQDEKRLATKKSRLLPKLSEKDIEQYRQQYLQRKAAAS